MSDETFRDLQVETLLAYYQAARAELLERLNIRANLSVLYIAAIGTVAGYVLGDLAERFYLFVIVIPLLAWGTATLWFQQNQIMDELSTYCSWHLCPYIETLWKDRGEARELPKSIDRRFFPLPGEKQDTVIKQLFRDMTEVTSILFLGPQFLSLIGIGIGFWIEMWGGGGGIGRLTSLVPEWVVLGCAFFLALTLLALTIREIQRNAKGRVRRRRQYAG